MKVTTQRLYAILRKAGFTAAKWEASGQVRGWGDWSPGVKCQQRQGLTVTYKVYGSHGEERIRNVMEHYVVPALNKAGITGEWEEDGLTYRVTTEAPPAGA